jgi:hypothetical protein
MRGGRMAGKRDERIEGKKVRQALFIQGIRETGTVSNGIRKAGIDRSTYKKWLANDPDFPEMYDDARKEFVDALEEVVIGIVMDPEAVKKSPVLMITMLNANAPWKYRPTGVVEEDTAREVLKEFRKAAQKSGKVKNEEETPVDKQIENILSEKYKEE